ncbi:MAG: protein translocase subunit SecD [Bradymonadales bacterium]|nr:MAG: protein translocase subunit SecD [Bradymonadales bacterium]
MLIVLFVFLGALYLVAPSFVPEDSPFRSYLPERSLNLGLDLQGGIHVILGVDVQRAVELELDQLAAQLSLQLEAEGIRGFELRRSQQFSDDLILRFASARGLENHLDAVRRSIREDFYTVLTQPIQRSERELSVSLEQARRAEIIEQSLEQAREILRNRVDEFGVAEPIIQIEGQDRILVQLPGVQDPDRAIQLIGQTALLEYKLVDDDFSRSELEEISDRYRQEVGIISSFTRDQLDQLNALAQESLPEGRIISFERVVDRRGGDTRLVPYLLHDEVALTGGAVENARVMTDATTNQPVISLRLTAPGAQIFEEITAANVGRRLAIVLDSAVISAPQIQGRIPAIARAAQITLGTGSRAEMMREARDLALVLRSGALPAPVEILENRTVGASLGQDSIEAGRVAGLLAAIFVLIFMAFYYRAFGVLADVVVALNLLMILGVMSLFQATLTLPGIAGIVLTIGICVDANVIIFERIREELRNEKRKIRTAIEAGYAAAHKAILDANITTAIAAAVLFNFGSGPIRGFAVTLMVGIICGYISAFWFSRWILEWFLEKRAVKRLWI